MATPSDIAPGVRIAKNLEATLGRVEQRDGVVIVEQGDGEVRYEVAPDNGRVVEVRVGATKVKIHRGILSVRIEAERLFVSVAAGGARLIDPSGDRDLVGGDLVRLARPAAPPPAPPLSELNEAPLAAPTEIPVVDSAAITQRRRLPTKPNSN